MIGRLLRALLLPKVDAAWQPTGIRQLHTGYDQGKAEAHFERERRHAAALRAKAAKALTEPEQERIVVTFPAARERRTK